MRGRFATAGAGNEFWYVCYVNDDETTTNYHRANNLTANGSASNAESNLAYIFPVAGASRPTDAGTDIEWTMHSPDGSGLKQSLAKVISYVGNDEQWTGLVGNVSSITAAVTKVSFQPNTGTPAATGSLTMYGRKKQTVGGTGGLVEMMTEIELQSITDPGGDFVFTVPSGYESLEIRGTVESDRADTNDLYYVFFNGDTTTTNYHQQGWFGQDNVGLGVEHTPSYIAGANSVTASDFTLTMNDPDGSQIKSCFITSSTYRTAGTLSLVGGGSVYHDTMTSAVTSITLQADVGTNLAGTLTLYGKKKQSIGDAAAGQVVKEEIARITNSTAGDFNFTSIPAIYDRLTVVGTVRSDAAGTSDQLYVFLNNNTLVADYHRQNVYAYNGSVSNSEANTAAVGDVSAAGSVADSSTAIIINIINPNNSDRKNILCQIGGYLSADGTISGVDTTSTTITAPVNQIQVLTDNDPTDELTGTLILYGERTV